jgi:hypothetical protein
MRMKDRIAEWLSPPDERGHLDIKIRKREARIMAATDEQERLLRLQKMIEVKGGTRNGG